MQIGLDTAPVTNLNILDTRARLQNLNSQLMSGNSRVVKKGEFAKKTADISSANAHHVRADQCLSGAGCGGLVDFDSLEFVWCLELDRFHYRFCAFDDWSDYCGD